MKLTVDKAISQKVVPPESKIGPQVPALLDHKIVLPNDSADYEIARLYIDDLVVAGFKRGAVVTPARLGTDSARIDPMNWGIILGHVTFPPLNDKPLRLIRVRWLNGSMEECNETALRLVQTPWWHSWDELAEKISKPVSAIT